MDVALGLKWIQEFNELTKAKAGDEWRLVYLDGHVSHNSLEVIEYAMANKIIILGFPPHTTHVLQRKSEIISHYPIFNMIIALDACGFAQFKKAWACYLNDHAFERGASFTKCNLLQFIEEPFKKAFTESTVKTAFRITGLNPVNANAITAKQMAPSIANSIDAGFPLEQNSPTKAMVAAFCDVNTSVLRSVTNPHAAVQAPTPHPTPNEAISQCTAVPNNTINPPDPTPDPAHIATSLLRGTSASFLLDPTPVSSTHQLHEPILGQPIVYFTSTNPPEQHFQVPASARVAILERELEAAKQVITYRRKVIERSDMQLVLQNLHLKRQNEQLHHKES